MKFLWIGGALASILIGAAVGRQITGVDWPEAILQAIAALTSFAILCVVFVAVVVRFGFLLVYVVLFFVTLTVFNSVGRVVYPSGDRDFTILATFASVILFMFGPEWVSRLLQRRNGENSNDG